MKSGMVTRAAALASAAVAALCLAGCGHAAPQQARLDFRLKDMNAHDVALSTFAGKPLVINFWATWCGPCQIETPQLVKLDEKYRGQGFAVVGISVDDEADGIRKFADRFRVRYPMLVGLDRDDVTKAYGYEGLLPLSVFIRRDGSIAGRAVGLQTDDYWEKRVQALLRP
jgi:cytochrome c biogenesis protein CcmG/thiol:disulfide interchange protein DsbE